MVVAWLLVMEFGHFDFSRISEDHPQKIVLIYDSPEAVPDSIWPGSRDFDSHDTIDVRHVSLELDSIHLSIDSSFVIQDSVLFSGPDSSSAPTENKKTITAKKTKKPVVRYYVKKKDEGKVYSLRKLGYYIHERQSSGLEKYSSNAIFYGDRVAPIDILTVAKSLIKQGMDIKTIQKSRYSDGWKAEAIEIGTDTTKLNSTSISLQELEQEWGDK